MTARPDRPRAGHLWHLAINVNDVARMERFYIEVMGFVLEWKPDADNVYLTTGRDNLALHKRTSPERGAPGDRLAHLGLVVAHADQVDAWAHYLRVLGIALMTDPRTHRDGARSFYFADPEGNVIQIIHHPPLASHV
jgi:catechol 2,3-dioxygenase-like lactoylglutathione lyase family enzyme